MRDFTFAPDDLTIDVGATVTWSNDDAAPHDAVSDDDEWETGSSPRGRRGFSRHSMRSASAPTTARYTPTWRARSRSASQPAIDTGARLRISLSARAKEARVTTIHIGNVEIISFIDLPFELPWNMVFPGKDDAETQPTRTCTRSRPARSARRHRRAHTRSAPEARPSSATRGSDPSPSIGSVAEAAACSTTCERRASTRRPSMSW